MTLTVREGEVVGIAGVEGNGQAELVDAIMGLRPAEGAVVLGGEEISGWSTRARREAGVGFVPEDRHRQGMLLEAPLWE
ncbi:ATP-binding cassette domain-containing protein, partial [Brevibacillus formosus]|uniref:ATP-binding cassette domain-containing protein n=1 Tax=Brevibacillus formosus TaxID=54913 RepID=UPI003F1A5A31